MTVPRKILNLGSGESDSDDSINVDLRPTKWVDVRADLSTEFPFESGSVDEIRARYVLEHLEDPFDFLSECHRVLKPGGTIMIKVPHRNSPTYHEHPDHKTGLTYESLDYLLGRRTQAGQYADYKFELTNLQFFYMRTLFRPLTSVLFKFFNRLPASVKYVSHVFPLDIRMLIELRKPTE